VERPLPDVPEKARATIHGKVLITVRVTVDAGGGVSNAELETPSSSKYFASLAVQAARHWRFQPVSAGSPSEARQWLVRFQFSATGTEAAPVEATR
jgi:TonB family protein